MVHSQDSFYTPIQWSLICILWYNTSLLYCLFPHIVGNWRFVFRFSFLRSMCVPSWSSSYSFVYSLSVHSHREEIKPKQPKHQDNDVMPVLPCFSLTMVSEKHIWRLEFQQKLQIGNQQIKKKKKKKERKGGGGGGRKAKNEKFIDPWSNYRMNKCKQTVVRLPNCTYQATGMGS